MSLRSLSLGLRRQTAQRWQGLSSLHALTWRNLLERKARTALTLFGIVVGVAAVLAINIANTNTLNSISAIFADASGSAHLTIVSTSEGRGFPMGLRQRVESVAGVEHAVPSVRAHTLLAMDADGYRADFGISGGSRLLIFGVDRVLDLKARSYNITAGEWLSSDDSYQMLLVDEYAREQGVRVGADLDILAPGGVETVRVVGLIAPEGPGRLNNGMVAIMPLAATQALFQRGQELDQLDIVAASELAESTARLDALQESIQERVGARYEVVYPASRGRVIAQMLSTYQQGLGFLSIVALFVGAFLIYNTFTMTVAERTREIGMLRALGMTRKQALRLILQEAGSLGLIGALLGVVAGIVLARGMSLAMGLALGLDVQMEEIPLDGLAAAFGVGLAVTVGAALLPAIQAARVSPLDALRIQAHNDGGWLLKWGWTAGVGLALLGYLILYRIPFRDAVVYPMGSLAIFLILLGATLFVPLTIGLWQHLLVPAATYLYGAEGKLGASNIERAKARTALTVAALMVGISMIIGIRAMTESYRADLFQWVETAIGGDLFVRSPMPMRPDFAARLEAIPGVEAVSGTKTVRARRVAEPGAALESVTFMGVDPLQYQRVASWLFAQDQGYQGSPEALARDLAGGDAVFVSTMVADRLGLQQGDTLRLYTPRGELEFKVAAIIVSYTNWGHVVMGSYADLRRYWGVTDMDSFMVRVAPAHDPAAVRQAILDQYSARANVSVESNQEFRERMTDQSNRIFGLMDSMALMGTVVAALGVVNTLMMNVLERVREIGMLRSLGMTRLQIRKMILAESGMMGVIGGAFGIIFGLLLSQVFLLGAEVLNGHVLEFIFPTIGIIVGIVIALGVSQVAALYPAHRAAQLNVIEAIKHE